MAKPKHLPCLECGKIVPTEDAIVTRLRPIGVQCKSCYLVSVGRSPEERLVEAIFKGW